ncbi:hypothetical protein SAMN04487864_10992 [Succiniclasticum ruminis]|uniref:Uncharacterized protein n=1 Tax=Succiniclasticum ruminis TaxID=40841 RepID=A0A1G6MFJ7_9FIRM|nr:hypothetical protein [Succiniclasticum ruminis]SDC54047.1 hypothetical protein SAMN04487864_10992 [Succiniclasticum ruminis]
MKNWKRAVTGILAVSVLTAGLALPGIAGAAATDQTETSKTQFKNGAVIPVSQSEAARLAAREKALSQYYITSGEKLAKAVSLLEGLAPAKTDLDAGKHYFYRMDKALTGDYFQHVKAFTRDMETLVGEYFIAKDKSCVFRRFPEDGNIELLEGTTEKLLKKVEIYRAGAIIPLKGKGKVLIRVPGNLPYDLTLTSLTENVATIQEENGQLSITGNARGYADILAEVAIGGFVKTQKLRFAVMDERDIAAYEARQTYVPVYVGMSWGWGWWDHPRHHHHHHHGGPHHGGHRPHR